MKRREERGERGRVKAIRGKGREGWGVKKGLEENGV